MREIKFRAKHVHAISANSKFDGIWVYGFLCDDSHIYCPVLERKFLIDKNTVGQYTGLYDKNGKDIYEGDIICFNEGKTPSRAIMTVQCDPACLAYKLVAYKEDWYYELSDCSNNTLEVIGNIYDNPELLNKY